MARFIILVGSNRSHMEQYISEHGYHFNRELCKFAVENMRNGNGKIEPWDREQVEALLKKHNVEVSNGNYDFVYIANMAKADFMGSSLSDEASVARYVKDLLSDPDQTDGFIFARFLSDCNINGIEIPWDEFI